MGESGLSRLQGAFRNYITFRDSGYQLISEDIEKIEKRILLSKFFLFCVGMLGFYSVLVIYMTDHIYSLGYFNLFIDLACFLVEKRILLSKFVLFCVGMLVFYIVLAIYLTDHIYSLEYFNIFIDLACFLMALLCLFLLIYNKYLPWRRMFGLFGRIFCCPWNCLIVPTEDRGNQTEEYIACQHVAVHSETEERVSCQPTVLLQRTEEQTVLFAFCKYFPSREIFRCPRSCYPTVSTEDLGIQTEEYTESQLAAQQDTTRQQMVHQSDGIQERTTNQLDALQATARENIASNKLKIAEQQLLQYLLSNTEEEESSSSK